MAARSSRATGAAQRNRGGTTRLSLSREGEPGLPARRRTTSQPQGRWGARKREAANRGRERRAPPGTRARGTPPPPSRAPPPGQPMGRRLHARRRRHPQNPAGPPRARKTPAPARARRGRRGARAVPTERERQTRAGTEVAASAPRPVSACRLERGGTRATTSAMARRPSLLPRHSSGNQPAPRSPPDRGATVAAAGQEPQHGNGRTTPGTTPHPRSLEPRRVTNGGRAAAHGHGPAPSHPPPLTDRWKYADASGWRVPTRLHKSPGPRGRRVGSHNQAGTHPPDQGTPSSPRKTVPRQPRPRRRQSWAASHTWPPPPLSQEPGSRGLGPRCPLRPRS